VRTTVLGSAPSPRESPSGGERDDAERWPVCFVTAWTVEPPRSGKSPDDCVRTRVGALTRSDRRRRS